MNKEAASNLKDQVLSCSRQLDKSIKDVQNLQVGSSADAYRRLAGRIMGLLYTNLLMPVYSEFPDLEPSELKAGASPPDRAFPPEMIAQLSSLMETVKRDLLSLREKTDANVALDFEEILDSLDIALNFLRRLATIS